MTDAVVIGAGPNGLVAANQLADAGWDVVVLEAQPTAGGAVRSAAVTVPGFEHDLFSAFYPLAVVSPAMRRLELERWGLRWRQAPLVVAHPGGDGEHVVLSPDAGETAASLDRDHPGDGEAWLTMCGEWARLEDRFVDALLGPFPPVRAGLALAGRLRTELPSFARFTLLPVRRLAAERFGGRGVAMLLAGNALHADLSPDAPLSGFFGWLLCCIGQHHGYPVPEGGAQRLTDALVARLEAKGGRVVCGERAVEVVVRDGRAVGVRTATGTTFDAARAVLADVGAPALYRDLLAPEHVPARVQRAISRFQYDNATVKVDWALAGPIPWHNDDARRAGTVHVADGIDHLARIDTELTTGRVPARPFLVVGQMDVADPTRSRTAWAYTHVPQGAAVGADFVECIEARMEEHAPGFRDCIAGRYVQLPKDLEAADANLVGGAINGGTAQLQQQLVFRPIPGLGRPSTPVRGLFLASASAHPGGGVHGACGANAASAAVAADFRRRFGRAKRSSRPKA